MRTSWDKLVQHVCTKYGQDIKNELNRKIKVNLVMPVHLAEVLGRHATWEELVRISLSNLRLQYLVTYRRNEMIFIVHR